MKAYKYIFAAGLAAMSITSCSDDKESISGEGQLMLSASINADVIQSRAYDDDDYQLELQEELGKSLLVWISKADGGLVREFQGIDNLPTGSFPLMSGRYVAEAWAGDSVPASWTDRWFKGVEEFNISAGKTQLVDIVCKVRNVKVTVKFADNLAESGISDYKLIVQHKYGRLEDDYGLIYKRNASGYFMMPSKLDEKKLLARFEGTRSDGTLISRKVDITNVKPGYEYLVNVTANGSLDGTEIGGAFFDIKIEEIGEIVDEEIEVKLPPKFEYNTHKLGEPVVTHPIDEIIECKPDAMVAPLLMVRGYASLSKITLTSDVFNEILGGLDNFEILSMNAETEKKLSDAGLKIETPDEATEDKSHPSSYFIGFTSDFTERYLSEPGTYEFHISAQDVDERLSEGTLTIKVSNEPVTIEPLPANSAAIWANRATVTVVPRAENVQKVEIMYESAGSRAANSIEATLANGVYTATITGLTPGTTYEYYVVATLQDGTTWDSSESKQTFTTAGTPQLPNAGFEEWNTSSKAYLVAADENSMFWDSGNHGSSTMSTNVTTPDETIKNSGSYSAKLASQFVGIGALGKFAAGNLFIGEYLATLGTNGVLGWGRTFNGRPTKLKGYVRYEPVAITTVDKNAPAEYVKGEMDKGIIYIALMDDNLYEYNGKKYPVIVNTKTPELFEKDGKHKDHVIAYGEMVFSEATQGDGMVEFTINLDYRRTDVIPSYIVLTASASKGGDYFTGGSGSNMWLDDLELIYE